MLDTELEVGMEVLDDDEGVEEVGGREVGGVVGGDVGGSLVVAMGGLLLAD